jgi:uncharacterized protein
MRLAGLLLSASFVVAAPAFAQASQQDYQEDVYVTPYWTRAPVIEALGRAELEVPPNMASFSVTFIETDRDASKAMTTSVSRAKRAFEAIKRIGGDKTLAETSVDIDPYFEQYKDEYGDLVENERADKIRGYSASATISVEISGDLDLAGKVRAAALAAGPEDSTELETSTKVTAQILRAAYDAAVTDAAARASSSAQKAGTSLGRLLAIQEGTGPCMGRWGRAEIGRVGASDSPVALVRESSEAVQERKPERVTVTASVVNVALEPPISEAQIESLNLQSDARPSTVRSSVCLVYAAGE